MAKGKYAIYAEKVFICSKDGVVEREIVFDLRGSNKEAREAAEIATVIEIKRLICEEDYDYLPSFYRKRLN